MQNGKLRALCLILIVLTAASVARAQNKTEESPHAIAWPTHGWAQGKPASVGLDEKALAAFDADLARGKYFLVDSFSVFRCGKQVFERNYKHDYGRIYGKEAKTRGPLNPHLTGPYNYFDPAWHPYYRGTGMHSMQSITKTVTSITARPMCTPCAPPRSSMRPGCPTTTAASTSSRAPR